VAAGIDSLGRLDAWQALARHADEIRDLHLRDLFAGDGDRGERLAVDAEDVYLDYSRNRVAAVARTPTAQTRDRDQELDAAFPAIQEAA
jgi:hypothetical protein